MIEKFIMYSITFGCAILFYSIGIYAKRSKTPIWFWAGSKVDESEISDVKKYNEANSVMWKIYSLWYFAAGIAEIWSTMLSATFIILSAVPGIPLLIWHYLKIKKKYTLK